MQIAAQEGLGSTLAKQIQVASNVECEFVSGECSAQRPFTAWNALSAGYFTAVYEQLREQRPTIPQIDSSTTPARAKLHPIYSGCGL